MDNLMRYILLTTAGIILIFGIISATVSADYVYDFGWGSNGLGPGEFSWPKGTAVDTLGNVYIVDQLNNRIQVFSGSGKYLNQWGSYGTGNCQFNLPVGIFINRGRAYVADSGNNRIQVFTLTGKYLNQWGTLGSNPGELNEPTEICTNLTGYFFVADSKNDRIQVFTPQMKYLATIGSSGNGNGQFKYPVGLAFNSSGYLYVADVNNFRIQVFNPKGEYVNQWGGCCDGQGGFNFPTVLAINDSDFVFVGDSNNHRVQVFDSLGTYVTEWGSHGTGPGEYDWVGGIAIKEPLIHSDAIPDLIYTADTNNHRIQVLIWNVTPVIQKIEPVSGLSGIKNQHLTIKGNGFLVGCLVRLEKNGYPAITANIFGIPSSNRIISMVNLQGATKGSWDVVIVNPGGSEARLKNGFLIR